MATYYTRIYVKVDKKELMEKLCAIDVSDLGYGYYKAKDLFSEFSKESNFCDGESAINEGDLKVLVERVVKIIKGHGTVLADTYSYDYDPLPFVCYYNGNEITSKLIGIDGGEFVETVDISDVSKWLYFVENSNMIYEEYEEEYDEDYDDESSQNRFAFSINTYSNKIVKLDFYQNTENDFEEIGEIGLKKDVDSLASDIRVCKSVEELQDLLINSVFLGEGFFDDILDAILDEMGEEENFNMSTCEFISKVASMIEDDEDGEFEEYVDMLEWIQSIISEFRQNMSEINDLQDIQSIEIYEQCEGGIWYFDDVANEFIKKILNESVDVHDADEVREALKDKVSDEDIDNIIDYIENDSICCFTTKIYFDKEYVDKKYSFDVCYGGIMMNIKNNIKAMWEYICDAFEIEEIEAAFEATIEGFEYQPAKINAEMIDALSDEDAQGLLFDINYMAVNELFGENWYEILEFSLGFDEETMEFLNY